MKYSLSVESNGRVQRVDFHLTLNMKEKVFNPTAANLIGLLNKSLVYNCGYCLTVDSVSNYPEKGVSAK